MENKTKPRECISWDECFMKIAHVIAERSKDPNSIRKKRQGGY